MRHAAVALTAAIACSGCAGNGHADRLRVEFTVVSRAEPTAVAASIDCEERPRLCAQLRERRARYLPPEPAGVCNLLPFATLTVRGELDGERIDRALGSCEPRVIEAWIDLLDTTILEVGVASSGRSRALLLTCSPAGGTVADAGASCRALARDARLFPPRARRSCGTPGTTSVVSLRGYRGGGALEDRRLLACREPEAVRAWTELLFGFHVPRTSARG